MWSIVSSSLHSSINRPAESVGLFAVVHVRHSTDWSLHASQTVNSRHAGVLMSRSSSLWDLFIKSKTGALVCKSSILQ